MNNRENNLTINLDDAGIIAFDKEGNLMTTLDEYDDIVLKECQLEVEKDPNLMIIWIGPTPITVPKNPCPFEYTELPNADNGLVYYQAGNKYIHQGPTFYL